MKSNIQIVKDYLAGERPVISVSNYNATAEDLKTHKEGEVWEDGLGKTWTIKNGIKRAVNKQTKVLDIIKIECAACKKNIRMLGNVADEKVWLKTGRCYDCEVQHEIELARKRDSSYINNLKIQELKHKRSIASELKIKLEEALVYVKKNKKIIYHNDDGSEESWSDQTRKEKLKLIKKDLKDANAELVYLDEELAKLNPK